MDESATPEEKPDVESGAERPEEENGEIRRADWLRKPPPANARCARCDSAALSALPTFSVGAGIAYRPLAEDVYCLGCGHIGLPTLGGLPPEDAPKSG